MAKLSDILRVKYPGAQWAIIGEDDYSKIEWLDQVAPKPDEATLRAASAEVDAALADTETRAGNWQEFERQNPDATLTGLQILTNAVVAIYNVLTATQKANVPATVVNQVTALKNKIDDIRAGTA